jgi:hypothetical protein
MSVPSRSEEKGRARQEGECGADLLFISLVSLIAGLCAFVYQYSR